MAPPAENTLEVSARLQEARAVTISAASPTSKGQYKLVKEGKPAGEKKLVVSYVPNASRGRRDKGEVNLEQIVGINVCPSFHKDGRSKENGTFVQPPVIGRSGVATMPTQMPVKTIRGGMLQPYEYEPRCSIFSQASLASPSIASRSSARSSRKGEEASTTKHSKLSPEWEVAEHVAKPPSVPLKRMVSLIGSANAGMEKEAPPVRPQPSFGFTEEFKEIRKQELDRSFVVAVCAGELETYTPELVRDEGSKVTVMARGFVRPQSAPAAMTMKSAMKAVIQQNAMKGMLKLLKPEPAPASAGVAAAMRVMRQNMTARTLLPTAVGVEETPSTEQPVPTPPDAKPPAARTPAPNSSARTPFRAKPSVLRPTPPRVQQASKEGSRAASNASMPKARSNEARRPVRPKSVVTNGSFIELIYS